MANPYSVELRERAVAAYERGEGTYLEVSDRMSIGVATLLRWVKQGRDEGHLQPKQRGGGTRSDIVEADLVNILKKLGDANAGEITAAYNRGRRGDARVHVSSIKRALHRYGYVVKKNASARLSSFGLTLRPNAKRS